MIRRKKRLFKTTEKYKLCTYWNKNTWSRWAINRFSIRISYNIYHRVVTLNLQINRIYKIFFVCELNIMQYFIGQNVIVIDEIIELEKKIKIVFNILKKRNKNSRDWLENCKLVLQIPSSVLPSLPQPKCRNILFFGNSPTKITLLSSSLIANQSRKKNTGLNEA